MKSRTIAVFMVTGLVSTAVLVVTEQIGRVVLYSKPFWVWWAANAASLFIYLILKFDSSDEDVTLLTSGGQHKLNGGQWHSYAGSASEHLLECPDYLEQQSDLGEQLEHSHTLWSDVKAKRAKISVFWDDLAEGLKDPDFRREFENESIRISRIDERMNKDK